MPIRIVLAENSQLQSQLLTSAFRRRPEFRVSPCPLDLDLIFRQLQSAASDVAVFVPGQREEEGFSIIRNVRVAYPAVPVVLLLESYGRDSVINAFRSGVKGIFSFSEAPFRALCKCITCVAGGQVWMNAEQSHHLLDLVCQVPSLRVISDTGRSLLTPREEQVVALVAEGLGNRAVSRELSLSEHTVKKYLFRIFDKLGVSNRVELVLYAVNHSESRSAEWVAGRAS